MKPLTALALTLALAACGDNHGTADAPAGQPDARIDASLEPDASCFTNPQTHKEIINACTDPGVVTIDKHPNLPLLNPDGTLPPLP